MIKEIIEEVLNAIDVSFQAMCNKDYLSYVLLIGRADIIHGLKDTSKTDCVIDYQLDRYYDETRENFYLRYLNRNYHKEGFHYEGMNGIDDLSIEMMIYDHLWDSAYFLKSIIRVSAILLGDGYIWEPEIPERGKWKFIHDNVINPLKEKGYALGDIIEKAYSTDIRNAFAHSLYNINIENRTITIRPNTGIKTFTFEDFQKRFLYSVILMNKMQNAIESNHDEACKANAFLTQPFLTPDEIKVQIKGETINKRSNIIHIFSMIRIE